MKDEIAGEKLVDDVEVFHFREFLNEAPDHGSLFVPQVFCQRHPVERLPPLADFIKMVLGNTGME